MTDTARRNGQLSSCEPCRKSKLRCDHARPQCGRCMRRRLPFSECFYHPAPMANTKRPPRRAKPQEQSLTMDLVTFTTSSSTPEKPVQSAVTSPASIHSFAMPLANLDHATSLLGMFAPVVDVEHAPSQRAYASLSRTGVTTPIQHPSTNTALIAEGAGLLDLIIHFAANTDELSMQRIDRKSVV